VLSFDGDKWPDTPARDLQIVSNDWPAHSWRISISVADRRLDRMTRNNQHDPNVNAARMVEDQLAADMQAAWEAWSLCVQNVDERSTTLLKAAFEAGYEAAQHARRR
jgi:hypothetical protein